MNAPILEWDAAAQAGPARAGGKGWQLGRMAWLGVPVPPGFVVAADAGAGRKPGEPVPPPVADLILQRLDERGWSQLPLAVRSSATMEDSAHASFAGIHRSCLNVNGRAAVLDAVRDVWDSLWTAHAIAYRERQGVGDQDAAMAVVVMPLLKTVASGIAFTCDPVSGRRDQLIIHAHWGLGESLVGGHAEGDEYRLQEEYVDDSLRLVERKIGSKTQMTVAGAAGGTELCSTPADQRKQPVLSEDQAIQLGKLARDAAGALDFANSGYDIEWAWDGERFWIVQARPVTASGRHAYPVLASQPGYWTRGNTREILPDPLSALDWGVCRTMANRMLTRGYELSGYRTLAGTEHAALFHGRVYLHASLIQWEGYDALGVAPAAMNQLLGGSQPEITVPPPTPSQRLARISRLIRYMRRSPAARRDAEAELNERRQRAAAWLKEGWPAGNAELEQKLRRQFAAFKTSDGLFFLQGSAGGTLHSLVEMVEKYRPGEGHALTAALMAGGEPSVTAQQAYALMDLAKIASKDAQALDWLRRPDRVGSDWARALDAGSPFRRAFGDFLARYGHRGVGETYLRSARWREAPDYLLDSVVGMIGNDDAALRQRQQRAAADAWERLRPALPFWLRPIVKKLVAASRSECNQREAARSAVVAQLEVLRRGALAVGQRFSEAGGLERPDDVLNLTEPELFDLVAGRLPVVAAARRAVERRRQLEAWAQQAESDVVVEHDDARAVSRESNSADAGTGKGDVWRGTSVGSGVARGRVHVAHSPAEGLGMGTGDVLVAPSTDPAWTPLFLKAGGLVLETGGYLSHGAIVAREFGIPAVANLPGILRQLHDGEQVEVDGSHGIVRRLKVS